MSGNGRSGGHSTYTIASIALIAGSVNVFLNVLSLNGYVFSIQSERVQTRICTPEQTGERGQILRKSPKPTPRKSINQSSHTSQSTAQRRPEKMKGASITPLAGGGVPAVVPGISER